MSWQHTIEKLQNGTLRCASPVGDDWEVNIDVKQEILNTFKAGHLVEHNGFVDKHNLLTQHFSVDRGIRIVPGGSSVRAGAYVAKSVIIMPPSYINIGAYVDEGSMVDSHVLVGSCAQVGKRVHLSAGVQIGGVIEPIGNAPVIIEDDAFIGAGSIVVEGIRVRKGAVLAPGVRLSKGIPVFDCVNERQLEPGEAIPERAVVIPGSRPVGDSRAWAKRLGLNMDCALIVKYRDSNSDAALTLEKALR
jgi:2,3,4,5-tetrahydropyridine-2,6-dicarboxylate N-succinyltransferase